MVDGWTVIKDEKPYAVYQTFEEAVAVCRKIGSDHILGFVSVGPPSPQYVTVNFEVAKPEDLVEEPVGFV